MSNEKISKIKLAANSQDWEAFQGALREIICDVRHDELSNILFGYISQFMSEFASVHTESLAQIGPLITDRHTPPTYDEMSNIIDFFDQYKGLPGVNNFRKALRKYSKLVSSDHCQSTYIDTWISSITNLFLSIPDQVWGYQNPDLYQRWLNGTSNEDLMILTARNTKDTQYIQATVKLWNRLADQLQKHIS